MAVALVSAGLLGLLVFLLGFNVSMERRSVMLTQHEAEADPASRLRKAIRAHGNCIEYAPILAILILALGFQSPVPSLALGICMIAAVVCRYMHAIGVLMGKNIYKPNILKFAGAAGTYLLGLILAIWSVIKSLALF